MNNSSAQDIYSIDLNDTITLSNIDFSNLTTSTITTSYTPTSSTFNVGAVGAGGTTYTYSSGISSISIAPLANISIDLPQEWIDKWPQWDRIQKMCEEYPGLKIAFEKFKTTYQLVKDDYDAPKSKK